MLRKARIVLVRSITIVIGIIYGLLLGLMAVATYQNHTDVEKLSRASTLAAPYRDISTLVMPRVCTGVVVLSLLAMERFCSGHRPNRCPCLNYDRQRFAT